MCIEITNKILIASLKRYDDWWTLILQDRGVENITDFRTKHMHNLLKMISWCDIQSQDSYWDWSIQKKKKKITIIVHPCTWSNMHSQTDSGTLAKDSKWHFFGGTAVNTYVPNYYRFYFPLLPHLSFPSCVYSYQMIVHIFLFLLSIVIYHL